MFTFSDGLTLQATSKQFDKRFIRTDTKIDRTKDLTLAKLRLYFARHIQRIFVLTIPRFEIKFNSIIFHPGGPDEKVYLFGGDVVRADGD